MKMTPSPFGRRLPVVDLMYVRGKYTYEMGYTLGEFSNALAGDFIRKSTQFSCQQTSANSWRIVSADQAFAVSIRVQQAPPRTLALLQLPVLQVNFSIQKNAPQVLEQQFFNRFFKYFHKGGG